MIGPAAPQRGAALGGMVYPVGICLGAVLSGGLRRSPPQVVLQRKG
jgi:hypothetical protein